MYRLSFKIIFLLLSINIFAQSPPHGDDFDTDCSLCHVSESWKVNLSKVTFDHSQTKFSLIGQHQNVDCRSCHSSLVFSSVKTDCFSCHKDIHQGTVGFECANCHTPATWIVKDVVGLHQTSRFPLVGAHKQADCSQCHSGYSDLRFDVLNADCYSCHVHDYKSARSPDHIAAKFSTDCSECHNVNSLSWNTTNVNHSFFPLTGGHALPDCFSCHQQESFSGLSPQCYSCHQQNYQSTTDPNHINAGFPTTCEVCHSINSWAPAQFNHDLTEFPLTGKHITVDCSECHSTGYTGTPSQCYSCHQQDYQSTTDPNHITGQFPTDCTLCHSTSGWEGATFDHNQSGFPLTGAHVSVACATCHTSGYTGTSSECVSCHQTNYNSTTNPNHISAGIPATCEVCHSTSGWSPAQFNHDITDFPLTGAHVSVECATCHASGYTGTSSECVSCHQTNYNSTTNPNHITAGIPATCEVCHSTSGWSPAQFNHDITEFSLTGAHIQVECASCHASGYTGTPTNCYACHQQDYQNTTDPNHVSSQFPTDCSVCHSTSNWNDATFNHSTSNFPLTGAHTTVACASCHASGYTGTPTDCYACHQSDYNNSTNPNHQAAGFPTSCVDCHSTTAWQPATFDHDNQYFPIYTGKHRGKWNTCAECHTTANNFSVFSCIDCHEHRKSEMDNEHQGVQGYVYNSTNCLACHPSGRAEGAFNHATSNFVLVGEHLTTECIQCHQNGYTNTSAVCSDCHISVYNSAVNPNHQSLGLSTDCSTCHTPNANWQPASFPQHSLVYQLVGRHAEIANNCASCHNGNYSTTPNQCVGCHQAAYNNAVNPNHSAAGIQTACEDCHNSSNWTPSTFNHTSTGFELIGSHQPLQCSSCHTGTLTGLNNQCITCHQPDYNTAPNHSTQSYPTNCELCHNSILWSNVTFNHQNTNFPLTGIHATTNCQECHSTGYSGTSTDCYACHQANYANTTNPNHTTSGLPTTCIVCHSTQGWQPAAYDHQITNFPLTGAHLNATCAQCHSTGYTGTSTECYACHQTVYDNAVNPNHTAAGIPTTCENCHGTTLWNPSTFNHTTTGFELLGSHQPLQCSSCHTGTLTGLNSACFSCHQPDYNTAPNHTAQSYPTNCELCHNSTLWSNVTFNHQNTNFPLTGAHVSTTCSQCHSSGYVGTPTECYSCHQQQYEGTTNPNHVTENYPHDCTVCHSTENWTSANFNHNLTNFPLTGAHMAVACNTCHASGYTGTPTDCIACHQTDYNQSTNPSHTSLALSTACQSCHTTNPGWAPATFSIHNNYYQLLGAHLLVNNCADCHQGNYNNTPNTCMGCHTADFNGTTDPPHQLLNFSENCLTCHTMNGWSPATFNHNFFPLSTRHRNFNCNQCHSEANYQPQCLSCHMDDFLDEHDLGDRTDCWNCHSTSDWDDKLISPKLKNLKVD